MKILTRLVPICSPPDCKAYLVGGFVRDWLIGKDTMDLDIVVGGDSLAVAQEAAEAVDGRYVLLDEENRVGRVIVPGDAQPWQLDITSYSGDIERDLLRRDFTVNAMALELAAFVSDSIQLLDPCSGEEDLKKGLLRQVNDRIFDEDPSRLMRAVRLAKELNLEIEPITEESIHINSALIQRVPSEKIREEMLKLLALPYASNSVRFMDDLDLLCRIIPELEQMKGVKQPGEHYWDVFDHSMETIASIEFLLHESDWVYGRKDLRAMMPWTEEIAQHFDEEVGGCSDRKTLIKLGALLHDIAKPETKSVTSEGRIRFLGHTKDGARVAVNIMERLRFSAREIDYVEKLVYHHLHPAQMAGDGLPTSRAIYRFFRDTEGAGIDIIFLAMADFLAVYGPRIDEGQWNMHIEQIKYILDIHNKQEKEILPVRLLDGNDLMREFKLSPGKQIGELLAMVREAQAANEIHTREEAFNLIKCYLGSGCPII